MARGGDRAAVDDAGAGAGQPSAGAALVGTMVHRLFQAAGRRGEPDDEWLDQRARAFLPASDERAGVEADAVVAEAVAAFLALRRQPGTGGAARERRVRIRGAVLGPAARTMPKPRQPGPVVVRGSIDCLAMLPDGRVRVVELKTGRPQPWHEAQLDDLRPGRTGAVSGRAGRGPARLRRANFDATGTGERASNQVGEGTSGL